MSEFMITARAAVVGTRYTDKGGFVVEFLGPSKKFAQMFSIRVVDTNRQLDSVPGDYALFPIDDKAHAAKVRIATLAGTPRDLLEPQIAGLDDDALDALLVADSRPWVLHAISGVLEARRKASAPAAPVAPPAAAAPAIEIVAQGEVDVEEIPLVATAAGEHPIAPVVHIPAKEWEEIIAKEDTAPPWLDEVDPDVVPEASVPESGARSKVYMAGRDAFARGLTLDDGINATPDDFDVDLAEFERGWNDARDLVASEPALFGRPAPEEPGSDTDTDTDVGDPVDRILSSSPEPQAAAPVVRDVRRPRGYEEKLGALGYPPAEIEAMAPEIMREIIDSKRRHVSDPGWVAALKQESIAEAVTGDHAEPAPNAEKAPDVAPEVIAPRFVEVSDLACPRCGAAVHWSCSGTTTGDRGPAYCSKSGRATTFDLSAPPTCDWSGRVERMADGGVSIVDDADRPSPSPSQDTPPTAIAINVNDAESQAEPDECFAVLRFLAERGVDLVDDDLYRFRQITGSVRDCTIGLRGTTTRHLPLVEAALIWARDHAIGATVIGMIEKRALQLRGARASGATPEAARRMIRGSTVTVRAPSEAPSVALSPSGQERAAAMQRALLLLHAAIPGYVAAMEALEALRSLGVQVDLGTVAPSSGDAPVDPA